jgi:methylated-DNA-[protein]-cysteine S-methyltransferase
MTTPTSDTAATAANAAVSALRRVTEPTPEAMAAAHARLEEAATDAGLLDVAYTTVDSPVGHLLLAATAKGLARVAFEVEDHDGVLDTLAARVGARVLRAPRRLENFARQLDEYFAGQRSGFDLPLDFTLSHGFRQVVQQYLPTIGYGQTRSYADVARSVGRPGAVRAVGTACATNPLPVVVPCHRVLRSDGGLGGYLGGTEAKRTLLALEAGT